MFSFYGEQNKLQDSVIWADNPAKLQMGQNHLSPRLYKMNMKAEKEYL